MKIQVEICLSPELRDIIQNLLAQSNVAAARDAIKEINDMLQGFKGRSKSTTYEDLVTAIKERRAADAKKAAETDKDTFWAERMNQANASQEALRSGPSQSTQTFADHVNSVGEGKTGPEMAAALGELAKEREDAMQAQFEGQNTPDVNEGTTL